MITVVAMPLATSPALYPPIPSASTTRPFSPSDAIESSLWARTIPGSVQLAISSAPDKVTVPTRASKGDVDPGAACSGAGAAEGGAQLEREFLAGLVALVGVLRHRFVEEGDERGRQRGVVLQDVRRMVVRDAVHELRHRIAFERELPAGELVQAHRQREQVAAAVDALALELLGRHIRGGPE